MNITHPGFKEPSKRSTYPRNRGPLGHGSSWFSNPTIDRTAPVGRAAFNGPLSASEPLDPRVFRRFFVPKQARPRRFPGKTPVFQSRDPFFGLHFQTREV